MLSGLQYDKNNKRDKVLDWMHHMDDLIKNGLIFNLAKLWCTTVFRLSVSKVVLYREQWKLCNIFKHHVEFSHKKKQMNFFLDRAFTIQV